MIVKSEYTVMVDKYKVREYIKKNNWRRVSDSAYWRMG